MKRYLLHPLPFYHVINVNKPRSRQTNREDKMSCKQIFTVVFVACMLICVIVIVRTFTLVPRQDVVIACKTTDKDYIKITDDILKRFQQSLQFKTVSTKPGEVNRDQLLGLDNYIQKSKDLFFFTLFTSTLRNWSLFSFYSVPLILPSNMYQVYRLCKSVWNHNLFRHY